MPNGEDLQKQLAEWEKQTQFHFEKVQTSTQELQALEQKYVATAKPAEWVPSWLRWSPSAGYAAWGPWSPPGIRAKIKPQIEQVESNRRVEEFYYRLYSEVPFAIQQGLVTSSYEALESLPQELINSLPPEDLDNVRQVIDKMVAAITGVTPMPEMARDMPELNMPELVIPTKLEADKIPLATLNRLTIDEIIKALVPPPQLPSPVLSESGWVEYLAARQGDVDDPEVDFLESEAQMLIDDWRERDNQLAAYREAVAEMPDYTLMDMLKEMVVQPGLALMEVAMVYFEHVSMPLAGALYKNFVPDMEKSYQEFRKTESTWKSLQMAWEEWDAPGEGAWEFILKYILMEGICDPLSYVGWGLATRITKPLGAFGRMVGSAERGIASALDIPFDLMKAGLRKLPKSLSQRAALEQAKSIQFVDKWVTKYAGKSIRDLSKSRDGMVVFNKAIERAIRNALRHPQADNDIARAGKVLLEHTPVDEKMVIDWSNRLAEVAHQPGLLTKESVSKEMVDNIDRLFEDYFTRGGPGRQKLTLGEAARELLVRLNINNTDDAWKLAQRMLDDRANFIVKGATAIGQAVTPVNAVYALGRRNFRIFMATEDSIAYLARKQMGVFATTMQDVSLRTQQVWRNQIDRWLVRPFAEAYLAFALYGPMNVIEDVFRSVLGGVMPNRFNPVRFTRKWIGVSYDPNLMRDAWSETLGELRKGSEAMQTNWILSLSGLAKGFGEKTYGVLVEKPGQIGISFRRGFVDARATQILKEMGGDTFEMLVKIDAPRPKLVDKKLAKEVYQTVNDLKMSANPDSIRYSKELFTRAAIHRKEVANILSEHPDMPRAIRDKLTLDMNEGTLIGNPEQITARIAESRDILMDDFIRSPERASEQMKELANLLTDLEIRNPEEMARVMYSLNYMAQVQGAIPKQVMKRVTQRTRGLPFEERSASINADMDRLSLFLENSKGEMQRVADKIKADLPNISDELVPSYSRYYDTLMAKSINASDNRMADMARRREYFARATAKNLKDPDFWEQFYLETDSFWDRFDLEQLDFDDLLQSVAKEMGQIQGVKYPTRAAVKVTDRALSPQDIATVMQVRMDDITKSLMESMMLRQDRARFTRYVMNHVTPDDVGFTPESVGQVYDQIMWSLQTDPKTVDWMTPRLKELQDINNQLHGLYNSKLLPDNEIAEIGRYVDDIARQVDDVAYEGGKVVGVPGEGKNISEMLVDKRIAKLYPELEEISAVRRRAIDRMGDIQERGGSGARYGAIREKADADLATLSIKIRKEHPELAYFTTKTVGKRVIKPEFKDYNTMRQTAMDEAHKWYYKEFTDYTNANAFDAIMKTIYPYWSISEDTEVLSRSGWKHHWELSEDDELLSLDKNTWMTYWDKVQYINVYDYDGEAVHIKDKCSKDCICTPNHWWLVKPQHKDDWEFVEADQLRHMMRLPKAAFHHYEGDSLLTPDEAAILGWVVTDGSLYKDRYSTIIAQLKQPYVDEIRELLTRNSCLVSENIYDEVHHFRLTTDCRDFLRDIMDSYGLVYVVTHLSKEAANFMYQAMYNAEGREDGGGFTQKAGEVLDSFELLSFLTGRFVTRLFHSKPNVWYLYPHKSENFWLRSGDIHKVHYTGKMWCPRVEHRTILIRRNHKVCWTGNTYETQRWFWLPRSFVRHPGTFTGFERWQNNTDYGYIHIPGTAMDYNPWRGTVYGTLTTRLARRDFPEYYDEFGVAGDFIEFSDFLSRYGFYPGAHIGIPLAVFGGVEAQFGEVMPAIPKTGLDFLIAAFPDNDSVRFISDRIFGDRFRNYLAILQVARRGGDGSLIFSKMQEKKELTEEEKQLWADARREVGWYSAGFEQFAMFRMRTDEQYKMYEESAKVIEEMIGYTPDQQDWLRKHGYRLWDMVGGMSPTQQATLQELEYYKWIGNVRPLLPGRQQTILNQIELAWDDVRRYSEQLLDEKLVLQRDFLAGRVGSQDYGDMLSATYSKQREYVDRKIEENPLMDIDNRVDYYKKYNVPQPVLHPMRELTNLYFKIQLEEKIDEETGEKIKDWDKFWAMRDAIDAAIPDDYREEWDDYLKKNSTSLEQLRREHNQYIKPYNSLWERVLEEYSPEEQKLIKEHQYLVKTGTGLERRAEIEATRRETTGRKLVSSFRSDISNARQALRYANPYLDAVLYYWGRTTTLQTPQAEEAYKQLAKDTGKSI